MRTDRHSLIQKLLDEYIEMYASRDDHLTTRFSENFSGFAGSSDVLIKDRQAWMGDHAPGFCASDRANRY
jgi:hypothetical protein